MPPLTASEVQRIAALARLELSDREIERFTTELAAILEYAAQVQRVDTAGVSTEVEPPSQARDRADVAVPSLPRAVVLEDAPGADSAAGFFTVRRVLVA